MFPSELFGHQEEGGGICGGKISHGHVEEFGHHLRQLGFGSPGRSRHRPPSVFRRGVRGKVQTLVPKETGPLGDPDHPVYGGSSPGRGGGPEGFSSGRVRVFSSHDKKTNPHHRGPTNLRRGPRNLRRGPRKGEPLASPCETTSPDSHLPDSHRGPPRPRSGPLAFPAGRHRTRIGLRALFSFRSHPGAELPPHVP